VNDEMNLENWENYGGRSIIDIIRSTIPIQIALDIISVQSITKEMIGDPTRGYENILTITYKDRMYEMRQYEDWENDGGLVI
jgi:hypothetical protein